jgi:hypothetical protein
VSIENPKNKPLNPPQSAIKYEVNRKNCLLIILTYQQSPEVDKRQIFRQQQFVEVQIEQINLRELFLS